MSNLARRTLLALTLGVLASTSALSTQTQSKPVKQDFVHTYFKAPPESLNEMITAADAVVRGRAIGSSPRRDRDHGLMTDVRFTVLELIHVGGLPIDPMEVVVTRQGGEVDEGAFIQRTVQESFPPFEKAHEYILFLRWYPEKAIWIPAYGPDSVFDLTGGIVKSPGVYEVANARKGSPAPAFLDAVRRFGPK